MSLDIETTAFIIVTITFLFTWFFKDWFDRLLKKRDKETPKHKCSKCGKMHRADSCVW